MKVTPLNIAKFWIYLMFPPRTTFYHKNRLALKGDLPWEPWLHCSVWIATIIILITGEHGVVPPFDDFLDWMFVVLGFFSPILGFSSVWILAYKPGRLRYVALWMRMVSDIGLAAAIGLYQIDRWAADNNTKDHLVMVMGNVVLFFSLWYTLTLVTRDIRFIIATEQLAASIYRDLRKATRVEKLGEPTSGGFVE